MKFSNPDWRWHSELSWFNKRATVMKTGTTKRYLQCQGIFRCATLAAGAKCGTALRAPANPKDRQEWIEGKACSKCGGFDKEDFRCDVKLSKEICEDSGYVLLTQNGILEHPAPALEKAAPHQKRELNNTILRHPAAKPASLATGIVVGQTDKRIVKLKNKPNQILHAFGNAGNVAYLRRNILNEEGRSSKDGGITDVTLLKFLQFQAEKNSSFADFIRIANFKLKEFHVQLQTPWQEALLTERMSDITSVTEKIDPSGMVCAFQPD